MPRHRKQAPPQGLRRRISAEFEQRNLTTRVMADRLTPAAAVRAELRETVKDLVVSGAWRGVHLI